MCIESDISDSFIERTREIKDDKRFLVANINGLTTACK